MGFSVVQRLSLGRDERAIPGARLHGRMGSYSDHT